MSLVGANIAKIRKRKNMRQKELAAVASFDPSNLSKLERGEYTWTQGNLEQLASALRVEVSEFFLEGSNVEPAGPLRGSPVQVWDEPASELPIGKDPLFKNWSPAGHMLVDTENPNDLFIVILRGPSMAPRFKDGDAVVMDRSLVPEPGDFVIATDSDGMTMFRKYREIPGTTPGERAFALVPLSADFITLKSSKVHLTIHATMIEQRKFRRK